MPVPVTGRIPPLPVLAMARASWALALGPVARNMPLVLIPVLLSIVSSWIESMIPASLLESTDGKPPDLSRLDPLQARHLIELFILQPIQLVFLAALYVSWLRYVVLGHRPSGGYFGRALWRYLGLSILFILAFLLAFAIFAAPIAVLLKPAAASGHSPVAGAILAAGIIVLVLWSLTRCVLKFAGVAIDDPAMTLGRSWHLMKPHIAPWLGGMAVLLAPIVLASVALGRIERWLPEESLMAALVIDGFVGGLLGVLQALLSASFCGLAYQRIAGAGQRGLVA